MIPSKQLLARFRFRPWAGLILSDEFLNDINFADGTVRDLVEIYRRFGVESIVETAINEKNIGLIKDLLQKECEYQGATTAHATNTKQSSTSDDYTDCTSPRKRTRR